MGTQQILLIVLSVVIVGVSVATGIGIFQKQALSSHKQQIYFQINYYVNEAITYRRTPVSMGGGGGSYIGWTPAGGEESTHVSGSSPGGIKVLGNEVNYFIEWYFNDRLKVIASSNIYGEGNYWPNTYNARITAVFDSNGEIDSNGYQISGDWEK